MADIDNNSDLVTQVTSHVEMNDNNVEVVHIDENLVDQVSVGVNEEDMLQNALNEGSDTFPDEVQMQYTDESEVLGTGDLINNGIQFITDPSHVQESSSHIPETFNASSTGVAFVNDANYVTQENKDDTSTSVLSETNGQVTDLVEQPTSQLVGTQFIQQMVANTQSQIMLQQQVQPTSAPLGSSQNPIRIIQQGNQYTPVQQLSSDQLQQIMQVVQQQQVGKSVSAGSSVLYNPQTNTRIVYRVIYPSQLHKDEGGNTKGIGQQRLISNTPRRTYKKRVKDEDLEKVDGPELTREEKEQRKKVRPKTRSGRVSKPPKHMMKDFKHIHVLDYDEDYDDSDGGYSDFKYSEGDEEMDKKDDDDSYVSYASMTDSTKPKRWKCMTCHKAYIGKAGLARHLKLNPSHGSIDLDGDGDMEPPDPTNIPVSNEYGTPVTPNGLNNTANSTQSFSEDSRDSSVSLTYTPTPRPRGSRSRGRGFRGFRGRGAYKVDPETRRRNKLKEIMRECTDEELMEIVLPRLAKVITLWEFLLMKVEKGDPAWPHADDIYREYIELHQHVKKLCQEYLEFVSEPDNCQNVESLLQVEDTTIADALGLKNGSHRVKDIADTDTDVQYKYKFLTTNQAVDFDYTNKSILKRTVEVVTPEQIISPAKKMKHITSGSMTSLASTGQGNRNSGDLITMSTTTGLSANKSPFISKIKILSPSAVNGNIGVSQCSNSGSFSSGKSVSLLSNSFTKQSTSLSNSLSSTATTHPVNKTTIPSSKKVILVSGTNTVSETSSLLSQPVSGRQTNNEQVRTSAIVSSTESRSTLQTGYTSSGQTLTSQNKIVLHDSVTGTYTVCSLMDNLTNISQASQEPSQNSSTSQQVILNLPQSTNSQYIQPKLVLNDMNVLNSAPTDTSEFPQVISAVTGEDISERQITTIKAGEIDGSGETESNTNLSNTDFESHNLVLTLSNGDPVRLENTSDSDNGNVIYALTNGDITSDNVVLTVDPNTMLVSQLDDKLTDDTMDKDTVNDDHIESTSEVIGVISSVDNSPPNKSDKFTTDTNNSWQTLNSRSLISNGDTPEFIDTSQINGNYGDTGESKFIATFSEEPSQTSSITEEISDKINNVGRKTNNVIETEVDNDETDKQDETIQIPATSIFQTEDGLIFIQNPDGTTLQLQGPDGQAASMETVQALLGMDLHTSQIVTEENGT
ncbi:hypothetical protein ACF0H5_003633 [Mactra antiquata]